MGKTRLGEEILGEFLDENSDGGCLLFGGGCVGRQDTITGRWLRDWQQAVTGQDLVKKAEMHPK